MDVYIIERLIMAAIFGGLIGLEREIHNQPAGLRTHIIVSMGSCLLMLISLYMSQQWPTTDPSRIASQIVTGIGFLGAGAIIRFGTAVRGLTTAACIWTAAGIGMATGCGYWQAAAITTALTLLTTFVLNKVEKRLIAERVIKHIIVDSNDTDDIVFHTRKMISKFDCLIKEMNINRDVSKKKLQIRIITMCNNNIDVDILSKAIGTIKNVNQVSIE